MPGGAGARKFVALEEIGKILHAGAPDRLLVCFDQSLAYGAQGADRNEKLQFLANLGLRAVYFASHASFLAVTVSKKEQEQVLSEWLANLGRFGICKEVNERIQFVE